MVDRWAFVLTLFSMQTFKSCSRALHSAAPSPFDDQQLSREDIITTQGDAFCSSTGFFTRRRSSLGRRTAAALFDIGGGGRELLAVLLGVSSHLRSFRDGKFGRRVTG